MFKRELKIDLVKPTKKETITSPEETLSAEDYVNVTSDIVRGVTAGVVFTVASYMACDTARKILVNRLSK